MMSSKSNPIDQCDYDQYLYKARHLIENFFAKLKQSRGIPRAMTNWLKTSLLYESNKVSYYVVCKCFILLILNLNDIY